MLSSPPLEGFFFEWPCMSEVEDERRESEGSCAQSGIRSARPIDKISIDGVTAMLDLKANKAIALRLVEIFDGRRLDLLEDVLHPEFRERGLSAFPPAGSKAGPGARRKLYETFLQAIPDARAEVLDVVAEGNKVVLVDRFGGAHQGKFFGRPGTGDRIEWMAVHIYTIRDGKIVEDAVMTDALAIVQQLGLVPNLTKLAE
jgi:predicted ester cyclase